MGLWFLVGAVGLWSVGAGILWILWSLVELGRQAVSPLTLPTLSERHVIPMDDIDDSEDSEDTN